VLCRPDAKYADLEIELTVDQVGGRMAAYEASTAVTLDSFDEPVAPAPSAGQLGTYAYDSKNIASGCSPGVTQRLARSSEIVKHGNASARYSATSTLEDNGGWSVKGKRFKEAMDLSNFAAIGFWLHGDAGGQSFKLQLRDAEGGWQDMYTRVDFNGWRYCHFSLGASTLKDLSHIDGVNIYYNGIPAGKTVTCHVDEIRVMPEIEPLRDPSFIIAGRPLRFPVAMNAGDRLVFKGLEDCKLYRKPGGVVEVKPEGTAARLAPGRNPVVFSLPDTTTRDFRVVASLEKAYP